MAEIGREEREELEEELALLLLLVWGKHQTWGGLSSIRDTLRSEGVDAKVDEIIGRGIDRFDSEVGTKDVPGMTAAEIARLRNKYLDDLSIRLYERYRKATEEEERARRQASRTGGGSEVEVKKAEDAYSEAQAKTEAATSITDIQSKTEDESANKYRDAAGIVLHAIWHTEPGACPICEPLHGKGRETWEKVYPTGPPGHPNCRCHLRHFPVSGPEGGRS